MTAARGLTLAALLLLAIAAPVRAENVDGDADEVVGLPTEAYVPLMTRKLFRGLVNIVTGLGEVPRQVQLHSQANDAGSIAEGVGTGLLMGVARMALGAAEAVTFIIPAPGYYEPLQDPPYVWEARRQYVEPADSLH